MGQSNDSDKREGGRDIQDRIILDRLYYKPRSDHNSFASQRRMRKGSRTSLISLNFSSASAEGFLSGWYYHLCVGMMLIGPVQQSHTFIACFRYAFLSSVSSTSVPTPSCIITWSKETWNEPHSSRMANSEFRFVPSRSTQFPQEPFFSLSKVASRSIPGMSLSQKRVIVVVVK